MTTEEKVLIKFRDLLKADATISGYVGARIYESHPSTIEQPVYPCISLHIIASRAIFEAPEVVFMEIQVDIWFDETAPNESMRICHERIKSILHRQSLLDSVLDLKGVSSESIVGQVLHEQDTRLRHLPIRYEVRAL